MWIALWRHPGPTRRPKVQGVADHRISQAKGQSILSRGVDSTRCLKSAFESTLLRVLFFIFKIPKEEEKWKTLFKPSRR